MALLWHHIAMPWHHFDPDPAINQNVKSVRHAGFAGYVGRSDEDDFSDDHHSGNEFDEDLYDSVAPDPTTHQRQHYDEHGEMPEDYYEDHDQAYGRALDQKKREDVPDHEDDELHGFIGEHGTNPEVWDRKKIDLKQPIYATQSHVSQHHIDRYKNDPRSNPHRPGYGEYLGNENPMFVTHEGRMHVTEGHHRVAAALQRGDSHMNGWHYDLDEKGMPPSEWDD